MTDRYERIRAALAMGPTPGPWKVDKELGAYSWQWLISLDAGGRGRGIGIAETRAGIGQETANAAHIAACDPDTIRALLEERDALLAALREMLAIVNDSRGVAGYHLNGDTAEWDEFDEVDAAHAAIAKVEGEKT